MSWSTCTLFFFSICSCVPLKFTWSLLLLSSDEILDFSMRVNMSELKFCFVWRLRQVLLILYLLAFATGMFKSLSKYHMQGKVGHLKD
jgi:hypothetical protein